MSGSTAATGLKRRWLLAAPLAWAADAPPEARQALALMASALTDGDPSAFLRLLDRDSPVFDTMRDRVPTLIDSYLIDSVARIREQSMEEGSATIQADWTMRLRFREGDPSISERRQLVTLKFRKTSRGWRVTDLTPASFFAL